MNENETLTPEQIEDLEADLAYHEREAEQIRKRLRSVVKPNAVAQADACPECGERMPTAWYG